MRRFQGILHLLWTHGMCLFKNSYVEALNTQCVFRKELKTGPRDGISALIKEIPESLLSLHVRIPGKGYVKTQVEVGPLQVRKRALTGSRTLLDLGLGLFSL